MEEGLLYQNGKTKITRNVFTNARGNQFVVANIKGLRDVRKGKSALPLILGLVCAALSAGLPQYFPYSQDLLGVIAGCLVLKYVFSRGPHVIYISGPQGEVEAFRTKDEREFADIMTSLKRAISLHQ